MEEVGVVTRGGNVPAVEARVVFFSLETLIIMVSAGGMVALIIMGFLTVSWEFFLILLVSWEFSQVIW